MTQAGNRSPDEFASFGMFQPFSSAYCDFGDKHSGPPPFVLSVEEDEFQDLQFSNDTEVHLTLDLENGSLTTRYQGREMVILRAINSQLGWRPAICCYHTSEQSQSIQLVHAESDCTLVKAAR
mmetsp:Transcript_59516/g.140865  ORF Transcript_59516/g.140865 Transcript_59516/m.140865 type:complete len:123 (-) Transcript_59516:26-394(-)